MDCTYTITNSERSSTIMPQDSTASSAATDVLTVLTHKFAEGHATNSFASRLVREVVRLYQKFDNTFPPNLPKVSTLLEKITSLREELKQKDDQLKELKDLKEEFEQRFSARRATIAQLEQELSYAKEDADTLTQLSSDVRCRQLIMMESLFSGNEGKVANDLTQVRNYRKAGDLGAHGAQIKSDLILTERNPRFCSHVKAAYDISLPPMISLFGISKEARQLQTHQVQIHPGSLALIQACLEHVFHFNGLRADPPEELRCSLPLPLKIDRIRNAMSTESRKAFDNHVGYNARYENIFSLKQDACNTYMSYANKIHRAVLRRHSDLYGDATTGMTKEVSTAQLSQEWWKDPEPLSLEGVNILRRLILAIDCLFKPGSSVCRGRAFPSQKSWEIAKDFYGPALASNNDDLTEAMVNKWEVKRGRAHC